jgi:Na+-driven multidrug efflux pump
MYGVSNVILTSAANIFTPIELSAKTITGSIEGIVYIAMNSYLHATMTLTAQNYGAGKYDRIKQAFKYSVIQVTVIGITVGALLIALGRPIMSLFIDAQDPSKELIIQCGMPILIMMAGLYFLCGLQETFAGLLRGLGYSVLPMIMSLIGICAVRIAWVYALFYNIPSLQTLMGLYTVYPISWAVAGLALLICILVAFRKLTKMSKNKDLSVQKV